MEADLDTEEVVKEPSTTLISMAMPVAVATLACQAMAKAEGVGLDGMTTPNACVTAEEEATAPTEVCRPSSQRQFHHGAVMVTTATTTATRAVDGDDGEGTVRRALNGVTCQMEKAMSTEGCGLMGCT